MIRKRRRREQTDAFTDLLFNTLIGFVLMFAIAVIFLNPIAKTGAIESKAEYLITVTWPDGDLSDVDTWVQDPASNIVWYAAKEAGLMHLDRDDTGSTRDVVVVNGTTITNPLNQETVSIRGIVPGEFTVNVHMYSYDPGQDPLKPPVKVTVKVERLNPVVRIVFFDSVTLGHQGDEKTAVRFTVLPDGSTVDVNTLPKQLYGRPS